MRLLRSSKYNILLRVAGSQYGTEESGLKLLRSREIRLNWGADWASLAARAEGRRSGEGKMPVPGAGRFQSTRLLTLSLQDSKLPTCKNTRLQGLPGLPGLHAAMLQDYMAAGLLDL